MASGDYLLSFSGHDAIPVNRTSGINPSDHLAEGTSWREGGSTPGERVIGPYPNTQNSLDQYWDYIGVMPQNYDGGGLTIVAHCVSDSGASGNITWELAFRAMKDDTVDIDTAHVYAYNTGNEAMANVAGEFFTLTITFSDGADMDSVATGDLFILRMKYTGSGSGRHITPALIVSET